MSLDATVMIEKEPRMEIDERDESMEGCDVDDSLKWLLQRFYKNILKKQGVGQDGCLYFGPFDWDEDVIAISAGNKFYRLSYFYKVMENRRNNRF